MKFLDVTPNQAILIHAQGDLPGTQHIFEAESIDAINGALGANRPLLIRGLPGVGKSQLARAAAACLGRTFVSRVVDAQVQADDLKWSFDTVERLAQAQVQGALGNSSEKVRAALNVNHFLSPGPLWWALNWEEAERQAKPVDGATPFKPEGWKPKDGSVLLVDEIDKADSSVPNGLLECLGSGVFQCPGGLSVSRPDGQAAPLVIVTTNEERVLPDAFLRRCLVLQMALPKGDDELIELLEQRGRAHHPETEVSSEALQTAARMLVDDRKRTLKSRLCPPGQAEFLDLIRALVRLAPGDDNQQSQLMNRLRGFVFEKHPVGSDR